MRPQGVSCSSARCTRRAEASVSTAGICTRPVRAKVSENCVRSRCGLSASAASSIVKVGGELIVETTLLRLAIQVWGEKRKPVKQHRNTAGRDTKQLTRPG